MHIQSVHKKLSRSRSVARCTHIQAFTAETLRITVGCLWSTYPSIRNKNLHTCGLWARPPVLTPVPVPSQAIHSRAGLNLHHSDIQSTAQKSPCVNTFFEAFAKKKVCQSGSLGRTPTDTTTERHDTRHTGQRAQRAECDVMMAVYFLTRLIVVRRRTRGAERCSAPGLTCEAQMPELAACHAWAKGPPDKK